jgi:hypothetical protein
MTEVSPASGLPLPALVETIKARVVAGDRDKQRSDDHYLAAGLGLIELRQRLLVEEPGAIWFAWSCRATGYGPDRISQLIAIGEGRTTQSELNASSAAAHRNAYQRSPRMSDEVRRAAEEILRDAPLEQSFSEGIRERMDASRRATAERDTCAHTSRPQTAAERQSQRRLRQRAVRVEAGADLPPPLAPIDHRRVLKEGRAILGCLDFDQLKAAVAALRDPAAAAPETQVEIEAGITARKAKAKTPVRPQAADIETASETNKRILLSAAFDISELSDTLISIIDEREIESAPDLREILDSTERAIESWKKLAACLAGEIERISPVVEMPAGDERYRNRRARRDAQRAAA